MTCFCIVSQVSTAPITPAATASSRNLPCHQESCNAGDAPVLLADVDKGSLPDLVNLLQRCYVDQHI